MSIILNSFSTYTLDKSENTPYTISEKTELLVIGISSFFDKFCIDCVLWGREELVSDGAINCPDNKGRVEVFSLLKPHTGTNNIVVSSISKIDCLVTVCEFSEINNNPIQDMQTITGTTNQNPSLNLNSDSSNLTLCLFADDSGSIFVEKPKTIKDGLYKSDSGLLGSYITTGDNKAELRWDNSSSWSFLAMVLRGIPTENPQHQKSTSFSLNKNSHIIGRR